MTTFRWYNPMSWRFFGYDDPATGNYVEVDLSVGGKGTKAGVRVTQKSALTVSIVWSCVKVLSESAAGLLAMAQQMHDKHVADGDECDEARHDEERDAAQSGDRALAQRVDYAVTVARQVR